MTLEIRPVQIPMTPDRTLMWEKHELQDGAIVLQSAGCNKGIVDTLINASQNPTRYRTGRMRMHAELGSGTLGDVYRQKETGFDIAVKIFHLEMDDGTELHQGLSGLRANVAVAEGIRKLANDNQHVFAAKPPRSKARVRYALKTPTYFAAVLYPGTAASCDAWAMSFESGSHAKSFQYQPPYSEYASVLDNACRWVDLKPLQIDYDCYHNIGNLLLRRSTDPGVDTDLIKIDSYAKEHLSF